MIDTKANKITHGSRPDRSGANNKGSVGSGYGIETKVSRISRSRDSFSQNVYNSKPMGGHGISDKAGKRLG